MFTHFNHKLDKKLLKFIVNEQKHNNSQNERLENLRIDCARRIRERMGNQEGSEWGNDGQEFGQLNDYHSISKATRLLEEVKDIRDELNILGFLLEQQNDVWEMLVDGSYLKRLSKVSTSNITGSRGIDRWGGTAYMIDEINEMDKVAERIQDSVRISSFWATKTAINSYRSTLFWILSRTKPALLKLSRHESRRR